MQTPLDERIAADVRTLRAVDQRAARHAPPPVPDDALLSERFAVDRKDSGADGRKKWRDDMSRLCSQVDRKRRNPTLNAGQILLEVDEAVRSQIDGLLAACDEEEAVIDTLQRGVDAGIDAALTPPRPEWHALGAEYRAVMRAMTDDQRADFVERVERTRDAEVLRYAIGCVPPELSGISAGVHKHTVDTLLGLKDPSLLSRPGDLKRRRAALAVARDGIKRTAADLVDTEAASTLRALVSGSDAP